MHGLALSIVEIDGPLLVLVFVNVAQVGPQLVCRQTKCLVTCVACSTFISTTRAPLRSWYKCLLIFKPTSLL